MHDEPTPETEAVARALCEQHIRTVRRRDTAPDRLAEMLPAAVDYAWQDFIAPATAAIAAMRALSSPPVTVDEDRIEALEKALRECLEQAEGCWLNHYGENPEGSPVPAHIATARAALTSDRGINRG